MSAAGQRNCGRQQQQPFDNCSAADRRSATSTTLMTTARHHLIIGSLPVVLLLAVLLVAVPGVVEGAGGSGVCDGGCQNGGKLVMPNNLFGYCRCRCPPEYKGPKCQYIDKRTGHRHAASSIGAATGAEAGASQAVSLEDLLRSIESMSRKQELRREYLLAKAAAGYDVNKPPNGHVYGFRPALKGHQK
jgi:hypothetical protein